MTFSRKMGMTDMVMLLLCVLPWRFACLFDFGSIHIFMLIILSIAIPVSGLACVASEYMDDEGPAHWWFLAGCVLQILTTVGCMVYLCGGLLHGMDFPAELMGFTLMMLFRDVLYVGARLCCLFAFCMKIREEV